MSISSNSINKPEKGYDLTTDSAGGLIAEEAVNTDQEYEIMRNLLGVSDDQLREIYNQIEYVESSYSGVIRTSGNTLEKVMPRNEILKYRMDNDMSPIIDFNKIASAGRIYKELGNPNIPPYTYFNEQLDNLYRTQKEMESFAISLSEYGVRQEDLLSNIGIPICSYGNVEFPDQFEYEFCLNYIKNLRKSDVTPKSVNPSKVTTNYTELIM